jgi:hypothetical protein
VKATNGTLAEEFKALGLAVPFLGGKWSKEADGKLKIDGRRAREITSTRTYPGAPPLHCRNIVLVHASRAYLLECRIPEPVLKLDSSPCHEIIESIIWNVEQKKQ